MVKAFRHEEFRVKRMRPNVRARDAGRLLFSRPPIRESPIRNRYLPEET
jgi:hypothetical protein